MALKAEYKQEVMRLQSLKGRFWSLTEPAASTLR